MYIIATIAVLVCWVPYLYLFLNKPFGPQERKQDRASILGILFQAAAVFVVWYFRRQLFSPLLAHQPVTTTVVPITAVILALGSIWFSQLALRALGENWSFVAGVHVKQRLIQAGPYAVVRHPLYVCFFGLVLATAMVWTTPRGLFVGVVFFLIGMWIRIHVEERLLRETFSSEFDDYARRVPAIVPCSLTGSRERER